MNLLKDAMLAVEPRLGIPYSGLLSWEKTLQISRFCGDSRKFSPRKSIFKQLDTALVGVAHLPQIHESFLCENLFSSNS